MYVPVFQHTAARRRLPYPPSGGTPLRGVSTHSRPKAAALRQADGTWQEAPFQHTAARRRLLALLHLRHAARLFQHTAARRRLLIRRAQPKRPPLVSTHSRPKAAASLVAAVISVIGKVSTHSRPKAAAHPRGRFAPASGCFNTQPPEGGCPAAAIRRSARPCFNTQPPEGGCNCAGRVFKACSSFNTQPPEGGCHCPRVRWRAWPWFQHTAARRRLRPDRTGDAAGAGGFQHTAARRRLPAFAQEDAAMPKSFNTQPPEGGCWRLTISLATRCWFQHTAARRRLPGMVQIPSLVLWFQHTAARRRLRPSPSVVQNAPLAVSTHSRPKAAARY